MRSSSTKALVTWFALAIQLLGSSLPATGLLLCFGADGHFDVEAAHEGRDCHADNEGQAQSDGCRDIKLSAWHTADGPKVPIVASPSVSIVTAHRLPGGLSSPVEHEPPNAPPLASCTRNTLRSIILLV